MKAIVCLGAFLLTLGSAFAIDNMVKGENFDGETGLKTGAQLEDLVTESYWSAGAFATNNAIRLFDASQFELGTDTTGIIGTNVATIKTGGITTAEILDGTIGTNDLSTGVLDLLNSDDYSASRGGFPWLTIDTNNVTTTYNGGTPVSTNDYQYMFDADFSTPTSLATLSAVSGGQAYQIDLGAGYSGIVEIKAYMKSATVSQFDLWYSTSHNPITFKSGIPVARNWTLQKVGLAFDESTNSITRSFTARYIAFSFASIGSAHTYKVYEIGVWGVTNGYDNLGGF
jgi:hypothetical protein